MSDQHNIRKDLDEAIDTIFRDYGSYGRHSKRCVYIEGPGGTDWCCASECQISQRTKPTGVANGEEAEDTLLEEIRNCERGERVDGEKQWPWYDDGEEH